MKTDAQKMFAREENIQNHVSPDQPHYRLFTLPPSALERIARGTSTYKDEMKKIRGTR